MTMYRVQVRPDADADAISARDWYRQQSVPSGHRFADELATSIASIADNPEKYPVVYRGVRRAMTSRFPYAVYFVVAQDRITILRILHQARDPREWKRSVRSDSGYE
jgi:plasmid stabilization system protein ParE